MNFLSGSIRVGRLFGINIRIHMLFLIWMGYTLLNAGHDWRFELAQVVMVFGTVLIHEFGHCFGARAVGGDARNILLWPLGGLAYAEAPMQPWPQFVTVAAGPIVHPIFCTISAAILVAQTGTWAVVPINPFGASGLQFLTAEWQFYVWMFFRINLWMFCFNMLPIFPCDGGQLFRTLIWPAVGLHRATILAAQIGMIGAVLLGAWGVVDRRMILVAIALFGGMTSYQHYQAARAGLATDEFLSADHVLREKRGMRGFWSRLFRAKGPSQRPSAPIEFPNPNPGGWETRMSEREQQDAELDRILKKVATHGVQSLSYVERQTLERITRERQREENEYQRDNRV
jgi:Zn-dependent protease